ncbi:hypothetical protein BBH56_08195 [Spiribacter roseus]|jgi:transcriptional regulator with XRE-family HTH domain|uniref:helix-turn-helix transcriptional regulator n=1 Tax=Spiribacter roseus TaxID=1855875 RepID=UPI000F6F2D7B|nr:hypothetical protein BBH56_08195 [Spiribacter roseus]
MAARQRVYSPHTREAVALLGRLVRTGRIERRMTASDVSERAGITRVTLRRIENGDPGTDIGLYFEAATIVGVPLFSASPAELRRANREAADRLTLLPRHAHSPRVDDDF